MESTCKNCKHNCQPGKNITPTVMFDSCELDKCHFEDPDYDLAKGVCTAWEEHVDEFDDDEEDVWDDGVLF